MNYRRGDDFRVEFAHLGEIRSLVPDSVHMMALTATATRSLRAVICSLHENPIYCDCLAG